MTDRPILFSAPMIRAILGGRKTQTRRLFKSIEQWPSGDWHISNRHGGVFHVQEERVSSVAADFAPYAIGDRLWVRESLTVTSNDQGSRWLAYAADGKNVWPLTLWHKDRNSIPSIHMPRWASRITLMVTDVRVERLQDISEEDAVAEGVPGWLEGNTGDELYCFRCDGNGVHAALGANYGVTEVACAECETAVQKFRNLWDSLNAARAPWDSNPWVVAVTFDPVMKNIDQVSP